LLKFKFDLNSNKFLIYKIDLKKKKNFLLEFGFRAETLVRPSRPPHARAAYAAQPVGTTAQWIRGHVPHSGAKSDPIAPDPPR
jgi:hypothetical protein